jgi:hypothetical protein
MMTRLLVVVMALSVALPALAGRRKPFVATETDFTCIRDWPKVGTLRVFHAKKRKLRKAVRTLEKGKPRRKLPKGTILQLIPFEAMVKAKGGFNKDGGGWEFFALSVSADGTEILQRTSLETPDAPVGNPLGSCQGCHASAADFDFVCGNGRGVCPGNAFPEAISRVLQETDPRCPPLE